MRRIRRERHPELSLVSLAQPEWRWRVVFCRPVRPVQSFHVYPGEARFHEVEFLSPFHVLATVEATAIKE